MELTNAAVEVLQKLTDRLALNSHHFGDEQAGEHTIFIGDVTTQTQAGTLFTADDDLVITDEFTDIFEADRCFAHFITVMSGNGIDEMRCGNRARSVT